MASAQAESEDDMTDNEIIKALECCINDDCDHCPDTFGNSEHNAMRKALDLINRQKAEIEKFRKILNADVVFVGRMQGKTREANRLIRLRIAEVKSEAIKEFAENFKQDIKNHRLEMNMNGLKGTHRTDEMTYETIIEDIDTLVEEMTEKQRKEDEGK